MKMQLELHGFSCVVGNNITNENIWFICISVRVDNQLLSFVYLEKEKTL